MLKIKFKKNFKLFKKFCFKDCLKFMLTSLLSNDEIKAKNIQVFTTNTEMLLVKKIKIKKRKDKDNWLSCLTLCLLSKKLYNVALYEVRQQYFENKTLLNYETLADKLKTHVNFKYLPAKVAQQTLKLLSQNVSSFLALTKSEKLSEEQKKKHKLPKFYGKGQLAPIVFTHQSLSKKAFIDFEKPSLQFSGCDLSIDLIKEKVLSKLSTIKNFEQINQVRITPTGSVKKILLNMGMNLINISLTFKNLIKIR